MLLFYYQHLQQKYNVNNDVLIKWDLMNIVGPLGDNTMFYKCRCLTNVFCETAVVQHALGGCGFPGVDVGHDTDVPDLTDVFMVVPLTVHRVTTGNAESSAQRYTRQRRSTPYASS